MRKELETEGVKWVAGMDADAIFTTNERFFENNIILEKHLFFKRNSVSCFLSFPEFRICSCMVG